MSEKKSKKLSSNQQEIIIFGCGILSSVLVVIISTLALYKFNFSLISWLFWLVVPGGAIFLGGLSSVGFILAARLLQRRISLYAMIFMVLFFIPVYFSHHYVVYNDTYLEDDFGNVVPLSNEVSFFEYYKWDLTSRVYTSSTATDEQKSQANPVGKWGYLIGLMEFLGFLCGAFACILFSFSARYCDKCAKYFESALLGRTLHEETAGRILSSMEDGNEIDLVTSVVNMQEEMKKGEKLKGSFISFTLKHCEGCSEASVIKAEVHKPGDSTARELLEVPVGMETTLKLLGK